MGARLSISSGAILALFLLSSGHADNSQFGDLDFTRLTKPQEQFLWKRLKSLAFEEAVITYCGQPDDFEMRTKQGIQSCVTADALNKADSFYRSELKMNLDDIKERKAACNAKPDSVRGWLGVTLLHGDCEARIGAGAGCLRNTGANDLPEIAHTIERFDRDCNLGFTASVIAGFQYFSDDALIAAHRRLDFRTLVVAGRLLPIHASVRTDC